MLWPSDPKENLAVWEQMSQGGEALLAAGKLQEVQELVPWELAKDDMIEAVRQTVAG